MPKTTISQVAAAAGVSIATASKALNGTDSISAETVQRVTLAAEKLGYRPNRAAQLLAGKNKHIGILLPSSPEPIYSMFENGLRSALAHYEIYGFHFSLLHYSAAPDHTDFPTMLETLRGKIQGLIFIGYYQIDNYIDALRTLHIPMVSLQLPLTTRFCPCVTVDASCVGRMAAQYLSLFCTRSAIITGDAGLYLHRQNIMGFREEAARRGMAVSHVWESFDDFALASSLTEKLIQTDLPDGIFVSSYVAPAVCSVLRQKDLVGRVKVIGVDIWERSAACLCDGSLSAVIDQNQPLQAKRAVDLIVSMMQDGGNLAELPDDIRIKPELVMESWLDQYYPTKP